MTFLQCYVTEAKTCLTKVLGIESLHELGIVHHDLKPENIVIDAQGHCRIADFGGSKFLPPDGQLSLDEFGEVVSTLPYSAPELLAAKGDPRVYYGKGVDWWSLGAIIMTIILGTVCVIASLL